MPSALPSEACEAQRRHIARELHDELGQRLSSAKWLLAEITQAAHQREDVSPRLAALGAALDDSLAAMRRIASDLRPPQLDDLGIDAALESLAVRHARITGTPVTTDLRVGDVVLDEATRIAAYRIVQEALTNVGRHAHASRVGVMARVEDDLLHLVVDDDGVGMPVSASGHAGSLGVTGMRERTKLLGGQFSLCKRLGGGTRLAASLPIRPQPAAVVQPPPLDTAQPSHRGLSSPGTRSPGVLEHELAVHEFELQCQNEELRRVQIELAESAERYASLYDFAPVGYLSLDEAGCIVEANLKASSLLQCNRQQLIGSAFQRHIASFDTDRWHLHWRRAVHGGTSDPIDLMVQPVTGILFHGQIICATALLGPAPLRKLLHITLSDVTSRAQAAMSKRIAQKIQADAESERRRLSQDLHEDLGQLLNALKMDLSALQLRHGRRLQDTAIDGMLGTLDLAVSRVRHTALGLRPPMIDDLGLHPAIEWLANDVANRTGATVTVRHDDDEPPLTETLRLGVFRLLQTLLSQLARLSAGEISIDLHRIDDVLQLVVKSSGTGWPLAIEVEPFATLHAPLTLQSHLLGGKLRIEDTPDLGRRLVFELPLPASKGNR